jgi:outer membrane protein assembly factor BamD (BamD/ComL family)
MRNKIKRLSGLLILLSVLVMLAQCATVCKETPLPGQKTEKMLGEIGSLEEVADKHADRSMRAEANLQLAKLYSSYKNPRPDYEQALKRLEMYLSFYPAKGKTDEMQNWLSLLQELVTGREEIRKATQTINQLTIKREKLEGDSKELTKDNKELARENEELTKENAELARENKELKDTVKALQNIDIKMEEKRKQIK